MAGQTQVLTRCEFPSSCRVNHIPAALLDEGEPRLDFMYGSVALKTKCYLSCSPLSSRNERSLDLGPNDRCAWKSRFDKWFGLEIG